MRCDSLRDSMLHIYKLADIENRPDNRKGLEGLLSCSAARGDLCTREQRAALGYKDPQTTAQGLALQTWNWEYNLAASASCKTCGCEVGSSESQLRWLLLKDAYFVGVIATHLMPGNVLMLVDGHCGCVELRISHGKGPPFTKAEVCCRSCSAR